MTNKKFVINTILSCPLLDRLGCNCQSQAKIVETAVQTILFIADLLTAVTKDQSKFLNKLG